MSDKYLFQIDFQGISIECANDIIVDENDDLNGSTYD